MPVPADAAANGLPAPGDDRYLTAETIAAELGVHIQTVQGYFRTGGLPGRKIGHGWRTTRAAFDAWLTSGPVPADGPHDDTGPHLEVHPDIDPSVPAGLELPPLERK